MSHSLKFNYKENLSASSTTADTGSLLRTYKGANFLWLEVPGWIMVAD